MPPHPAPWPPSPAGRRRQPYAAVRKRNLRRATGGPRTRPRACEARVGSPPRRQAVKDRCSVDVRAAGGGGGGGGGGRLAAAATGGGSGTGTPTAVAPRNARGTPTKGGRRCDDGC